VPVDVLELKTIGLRLLVRYRPRIFVYRIVFEKTTM
jgi:hypothetical protein